MSKLILLMGLPCSGKTSFSKGMKDIVLEIDEIRKNITGTYDIRNSHNSFVQDIVKRITYYHLKSNKQVVLDGTFLSLDTRKEYIDLAKKINIKVDIYWFDPSWELIKKRLHERNKSCTEDRRLDLEFVFKMHEKLEIPILDEGIEKIHYFSDDELA